MPTNVLRQRGSALSAADAETRRPRADAARRVLIRAGGAAVRCELLDTPTAERIWMALPIYSTAETWGQAVHFETPVESGRERGARALAEPGGVYFWSEEDRVIITFGPTPISRAGEVRLPRPCNLWAKLLDDASPLKSVAPGAKVSMTAL